jgi:DNA-binding MarR family transcriptional regulator
MPVRVLVGLLCACGAAAAVAQAQTPPPQQQSPQALFRTVLLADPATSSGVARLLRTNAGFVSPTPVFADLTGDGKQDAIATVENGGAAGAVAAYVLSADGSADGQLHALFRVQSLYQGRVRVNGATLTVITPLWSRGEDVCCGRRSLERDYAGGARLGRLPGRGVRTVTATRGHPAPPAPDVPASGVSRTRNHCARAILARVQATSTGPQVTPQELATQLVALWQGLMRGSASGVYAIVADLDLSLTQMKTMHALADSGSEVSVKELADRLGLSLPATSRTVDALLRRGWLERREDEPDRRMQRVGITPAEREIANGSTTRACGRRQFTASLTPEQQSRLARPRSPKARARIRSLITDENRRWWTSARCASLFPVMLTTRS